MPYEKPDYDHNRRPPSRKLTRGRYPALTTVYIQQHRVVEQRDPLHVIGFALADVGQFPLPFATVVSTDAPSWFWFVASRLDQDEKTAV